MTSKPEVLQKRLYTARAVATGGRSGRVTADPGAFDMTLSLPRELGGAGGPGTNPEELFAAGYAACFGTGLATIAAAQKIQTGLVTIAVEVAVGPVPGGFGLAVELTAHLPGLPREQAEALVRATHEVCPYSRATRGNIAVELRVG